MAPARMARRVGLCLALVAAAALLVATRPAWSAPPAVRIEVHPLATLTPTRSQLLAGISEGSAAATIAGELRLPAVAAARLPAVLMLHGDAGAVVNQVVWIEELNALGIAVFTLDSFSGRGAVAPSASLTSMPSSVGGLGRIVDAERALALLSKHPRIDPSRIAVMGFSSGGRTVLGAAQTRFATAFGTPGLRFAAYIALYPGFNDQLIGDTASEPGPHRIFIGEADVVTAADACVRYAARLREAGADIAVATFAGAHHGFDSAAPGLTRIADFSTAARCNLREVSRGTIVNIDTGKPLAEGDACFDKGLVAGRDAAADSATKGAVKALLIERFGLSR